MNTDTATNATPEAFCSTAMLGPVRRALDGLAFAAHQAGECEKQLGDSAEVLDWIEYVMCEVAAEREAAVAAERERCAKPVPDEWLVKVRRLVQGFEHVSGIARLWEPDYSSGNERALWSRATEACADVAKPLREAEGPNVRANPDKEAR